MSDEQFEKLVKENRNRIERLVYLGVLTSDGNSCRDYNVGKSDYACGSTLIEPWTIWMDWKDRLTSWDCDIIKRLYRHKEGEDATMKYNKIIHICQERLRQLSYEKPSQDKG